MIKNFSKLRTCSKVFVIIYFVFVLVGVFMASTPHAEEEVITNKLYMKLDADVGGYLTIYSDEFCQIDNDSVKRDFPHKALIENGQGQVRQGCWGTFAPPDEHHVELVVVVEEMLINVDNQPRVMYNVGSFAKYYFVPNKD